MKKIGKRIIQIVVSIVALLLLLMLLIPVVFKDQILTKVKEEINSQVEATVAFSDVTLSLFRSFPDFNLGLHDLTVIGQDKFAGDTLVAFDAFRVEVDLLSALKGKVQVEGILLDGPQMHARVLADSSANWDIVTMEDTTATPEKQVADTAESATTDMRIALKRLEIRNASVVYDDAASDIYARLNDWNLLLAGDFGADYSDMDLTTTIADINVKMGEVQYLKNTSFSFDTRLGADLEEMAFQLKENTLMLNDLSLAFSGEVAMPGEDIAIQLDFATTNTSFKSLLSMVPAVYMQGYEDLQTSGTLKLNGAIQGVYNAEKELLPSAKIQLAVDKGRIQYPDLPKSIENIALDLQVQMNGEELDKTTVALSKFHFELGSNPFDLYAHISTPISDPGIRAGMKGTLVLQTLSEALHLDEMELEGTLQADVKMNGQLSTLEAENYESFDATGELLLSDFVLNMADLPGALRISEADLTFSPQFLAVNSFDGSMGESDFFLKGRVEQYIGYVLSDATLRADFSMGSKYFNTNPFLTLSEEGETDIDQPAEEAEEITGSDTMAVSAVQVPGNLDVKLTCTIDKLLYDKLEVTDLSGTVLIKDEQVHLDELNMNLLDGTVGVNGVYDTQDHNQPTATMRLDVKNMNIQTAVQSFSMLDTLAPVLRQCDGNISLNLEYSSLLNVEMSPVLNSVNGYGRLQSDNLQLVNNSTYNKMTNLLKLGDKLDNQFKDVNISFSIQNGRIIVEPFDVEVGDVMMVVGGSHGLDQTMDYDLNMQIPRQYVGTAANDALEGLLEKAAEKGVNVDVGNTIPVKARIYGNMEDPQIGLNYGEASGKAKQDLKQKVNDELNKQKEQAEAKAREEAEKKAQALIDDAEAEATRIKKEAREAADKVLKEAEAEANKLVEKAAKEGMLAKIAAEKAAEAAKKEARKQADNLIKKADEKADKIVEEARKRAAAIREE
ncbi:MAG: AsmA-like C-terminal region-containing protein [Bacteroidota bacterium]